MIKFNTDRIEITNIHVGSIITFIIVLITLNILLPYLIILKYIFLLFHLELRQKSFQLWLKHINKNNFNFLFLMDLLLSFHFTQFYCGKALCNSDKSFYCLKSSNLFSNETNINKWFIIIILFNYL